MFGLEDSNLCLIEAKFASLVYAALTALKANWDSLVNDIENGTMIDSLHTDETVRKELNQSMSAERTEELRRAIDIGLTVLAHRLWSKLNFVMTAYSETFQNVTDDLHVH